ncbi:MAG: hypothetical protein WDN00_13780 [Limisphaerales bacterium]
MFLLCLAQGIAESEIQIARGQIERLQHEREQVSAQTAELVARKICRMAKFPRAKKIYVRSAAA